MLEGFFFEEEDVILSRDHSTGLGYRIISDYEDSVNNGKGLLPREWIPGSFGTGKKVSDVV